MSNEGWQKPEVISDEQWEKLEEWEKAELARTSATSPPQIEEPTGWVRPEGVTDEEWEMALKVARIRAMETPPVQTGGLWQWLSEHPLMWVVIAYFLYRLVCAALLAWGVRSF